MQKRGRKRKKIKTTSVSLSVIFWCFLCACAGGGGEEGRGLGGSWERQVARLGSLGKILHAQSSVKFIYFFNS